MVAVRGWGGCGCVRAHRVRRQAVQQLRGGLTWPEVQVVEHAREAQEATLLPAARAST